MRIARHTRFSFTIIAAFVLIASLTLEGCSGKGGGNGGSASYTVGGAVSGLAGSGLVLQNNGGDELAVSANGTFTFATAVADNAAYAVTVKTQPSGPSQTCTASNNTGAMAGANITGVSVVCSTKAYTVGGAVSGLVGSGLVLQNNGGDNYAVSANGTFTFATAVADNAGYAVTVKTQPSNPSQTCTANSNTGTMAGANVTGVSVICTTNAYTVGGTVSGLAGSGLVLKNNGGGDLTVSSNGTFTFATPVADTAAYLVEIKTQPHSLSQTCEVDNGTGTIFGANISNVTVSCTTNAYTVSATVTELAGSGLELQNNGGDNLAVSANGTFTFATAIADGATYTVTVVTQPSSPSQTCTANNNTGAMAGANVTGVSVVCSTNAYTVGGMVSGLTSSGSGLVLQNNGTDDLTVFANDTFTFATAVADGAGYAVTVKTRPSNPTQACVVTDGTGTMTGENVTGISVACTTVHSSLDKISAAETAGYIDHDTALLYTLYVGFDPTSLPDEYRGDDSEVMISGTRELLELASRLELLSAELQAKVQSFLLRPDDPQSVWNKRMNELLTASSSPGLLNRMKRAIGFGSAPQLSSTITWTYVASGPDPIRVWYPESAVTSTLFPNDAQAKDMAEKLASEIYSSGMWATESAAMLGTVPCGDGATGGSVNLLDVYILPAGMGLNWETREFHPLLPGYNGMTIRETFSSGCGYVPFILINGSIGSDAASFDTLRTVMAHELFHAFQYHLGMSNGYRSDSAWWMEATATWAEDLVYPYLNKEQDWLYEKNNRWANVSNAYLGPLDYDDGNSIAYYAAYLWPFYLSHSLSRDSTKIGELWEQSASMPALQAMANLSSWPEDYKDFALWNWNQKPWQKYYDPGTDSGPNGEIVPLQQKTLRLLLDPATDTYGCKLSLIKTEITYVDLAPPATTVKQLEFDQSEFANKAGWGLQAIITLDTPTGPLYKETIEDWSSLPKRTFCLETEPVTKIILVASNSNIDSSGTLAGELKLKELTSGCFFIEYDWLTSDGQNGRDESKFGRIGGIAQPSGFSDSPTYTEMLAYKDGPSSGPYTDLSFFGNTPGAYLGPGKAFMTRLESYTGYWTAQQFLCAGPIGVDVNVTRMDDVGGVIEGTFSGTLCWTADTSITMNITNGKFRVKRVGADVWSAQ